MTGTLEALAPQSVFETIDVSPYKTKVVKNFIQNLNKGMQMYDTNLLAELDLSEISMEIKEDFKRMTEDHNFQAKWAFYDQQFMQKLGITKTEGTWGEGFARDYTVDRRILENELQQEAKMRQLGNRFILLFLLRQNDFALTMLRILLKEIVDERQWKFSQWQKSYIEGSTAYFEIYGNKNSPVLPYTWLKAVVPKLMGQNLTLDKYKFVRAKLGGSMPGGVYSDENNQQWLIKWGGNLADNDLGGTYKYEWSLREVMLAQMLRKMGINMPKTKVVRGKKGHVYVASEYQEKLFCFKDILKGGGAALHKINKKELQKIFAYALLTGNSDFFNPYNDNIYFTEKQDSSGNVVQYEPLLIEVGNALNPTSKRLTLMSEAVHGGWLQFLKWSHYFEGEKDNMKNWIMEGFTEKDLQDIFEDMKNNMKGYISDESKYTVIEDPKKAPEEVKIFSEEDYCISREGLQKKGRVFLIKEGQNVTLKFSSLADSLESWDHYTKVMDGKTTLFKQKGVQWTMILSKHKRYGYGYNARSSGSYKKSGQQGIVFSFEKEKNFFYDLLSLGELEEKKVLSQGKGLEEKFHIFIKEDALQKEGGISINLPVFQKIENLKNFQDFDKQVQNRIHRGFRHHFDIMKQEIERQEAKFITREQHLRITHDEWSHELRLEVNSKQARSRLVHWAQEIWGLETVAMWNKTESPTFALVIPEGKGFKVTASGYELSFLSDKSYQKFMKDVLGQTVKHSVADKVLSAAELLRTGVPHDVKFLSVKKKVSFADDVVSNQGVSTMLDIGSEMIPIVIYENGYDDLKKLLVNGLQAVGPSGQFILNQKDFQKAFKEIDAMNYISIKRTNQTLVSYAEIESLRKAA